LPRARLQRRGVLARDRAESDGRAGHGLRAEAVVALHAAARGDEETVADGQAVLEVGPEVRPRGPQEGAGALAELARLALAVRARGHEVAAPEARLGLVPGGEPAGVVLEAERVHEVADRERTHVLAVAGDERARVRWVAGELVRGREPDPHLVGRGSAHEPQMGPEHDVRAVEAALEVGPAVARLPRRAEGAVLDPGGDAQGVLVAETRAQRGGAGRLREGVVRHLVVGLETLDAGVPVVPPPLPRRPG